MFQKGAKVQGTFDQKDFYGSVVSSKRGAVQVLWNDGETTKWPALRMWKNLQHARTLSKFTDPTTTVVCSVKPSSRASQGSDTPRTKACPGNKIENMARFLSSMNIHAVYTSRHSPNAAAQAAHDAKAQNEVEEAEWKYDKAVAAASALLTPSEIPDSLLCPISYTPMGKELVVLVFSAALVTPTIGDMVTQDSGDACGTIISYNADTFTLTVDMVPPFCETSEMFTAVATTISGVAGGPTPDSITTGHVEFLAFANGRCYKEKEIHRWVVGNGTCPFTRKPLRTADIARCPQNNIHEDTQKLIKQHGETLSKLELALCNVQDEHKQVVLAKEKQYKPAAVQEVLKLCILGQTTAALGALAALGAIEDPEAIDLLLCSTGFSNKVAAGEGLVRFPELRPVVEEMLSAKVEELHTAAADYENHLQQRPSEESAKRKCLVVGNEVDVRRVLVEKELPKKIALNQKELQSHVSILEDAKDKMKRWHDMPSDVVVQVLEPLHKICENAKHHRKLCEHAIEGLRLQLRTESAALPSCVETLHEARLVLYAIREERTQLQRAAFHIRKSAEHTCAAWQLAKPAAFEGAPLKSPQTVDHPVSSSEHKNKRRKIMSQTNEEAKLSSDALELLQLRLLKLHQESDFDEYEYDSAIHELTDFLRRPATTAPAAPATTAPATTALMSIDA